MSSTDQISQMTQQINPDGLVIIESGGTTLGAFYPQDVLNEPLGNGAFGVEINHFAATLGLSDNQNAGPALSVPGASLTIPNTSLALEFHGS